MPQILLQGTCSATHPDAVNVRVKRLVWEFRRQASVRGRLTTVQGRKVFQTC
jgi:hypothetical protein